MRESGDDDRSAENRECTETTAKAFSDFTFCTANVSSSIWVDCVVITKAAAVNDRCPFCFRCRCVAILDALFDTGAFSESIVCRCLVGDQKRRAGETAPMLPTVDCGLGTTTTGKEHGIYE